MSNLRARWVDHRNRTPRSQKLIPDFKKIPEAPKMDQKSLSYFLNLDHVIRVTVPELILNDGQKVSPAIFFQILQPTHFWKKKSNSHVLF